MLHGTDVFISAEIKNNGVTIDYAYGCDNKKTDVTVDTNILYKKTHETYSVSTDIIGSTRWAFDSIGNVCASTEYDAWGNVTENSGLTVNASVPTVNITKSYTGHIYDEGTGFWNAGAREYDPFTKRFTSMDPENGNIYMPDTLHKYSYASNNPVMNVDLNGRFTTSTFEKAACSAVKAAIGGIYTFTKTTVNVWNDFNNLIDRIPAPVKAAVAIAGTGIAIASGVAPGAAALTMAMAMGEGAAVNLAFYAAGSYVTGKQMTWKDAIKTAGKGALDGAFLNGIGQGIAGAGRILVNNKAGIKKFYVDETGSVKIDGVGGSKADVTTGIGYNAGDTQVRVDGDWTENDMKQALLGHPPRGLGSPDIHHGGQMPGGALHEVLPGQHRNNPALHQNTYNQGVTPEMRMEDRQLHWWYRAREQGADELLPDSYKDFVSQYGGGYFGFIVVYSCDCNGMFYIEDNVLKEWVAEKCFYQLSI